ncbi:MAG: hypothetical protein EAZ55_04700 [Cytophagales bacterium]|nr:MAG: hypothetical protein EAZ55_04700 [Cytophagales bacterium]
MKLYFLKLYIVLAIGLFLQHSLKAQRYNFRTYSLEEGLPQSEIWALLQDSRGAIWAGTNGGGLVRFNGFHFQVFSQKDGLPNTSVRTLYEDSKKNIWINTFSGVSRYNGLEFHTFPAKEGDILENNFSQIIEDKNGKIWLYQNKNQSQSEIFIFENTPQKPTYVNIRTLFPKIFSQNIFIQGIIRRKDGNILIQIRLKNAPVGTPNSLYEYDGKSVFASSIQNSVELFKDKTLFPLIEDKQGRVWLGVANQQNAVIGYYKDKQFVELKLPPNVAINQINKFYEDRNGNIWILVNTLGLVKYDGITFKTFSNINGLPSRLNNDLIQDFEGNYWVGTSGNGLVKLSKSRFLSLSKTEGLLGEIIRSVQQDLEGNYWIGSNSGHLAKWTDKEELFTDIFQGNNNLGRVKPFYEIEKGIFLIPTDAGVLRFQNGSYQNVNNQYGLPNNLGASWIIPDGKYLWLSTWGNGVYRFNTEDKSVVNFNVQNGKLLNNLVHSIYKDSKGRIWVCTNFGLTAISGQKIQHFDTQRGLSNNLIMQVVEDKYQQIWIATFNGGLNKYDGKKITIYNPDNSDVSALTIYSITTNQTGDAIWIGTQKGADKITLDNKGDIAKIRNYTKYDGFSGEEANGAAIYRDTKGRIWFGTIKGAMMYNPEEDTLNNIAPKIYINNIKLFFREIAWKEEKYQKFYSRITPWFNTPEDLVLPYDSNHITFQFEALSYEVNEKVRYQWMLEGVDKDWSPVSNKTEAVYPNLPYGKYTFKVRACNNDGKWTEEPAIYTFEITPPWWRRWWVQSIFIGSSLFAAFAGVRMRIKAIQAQKIRLQQLVEEQTIEIRKQNQEILQKNAELEQQKEEILVQSENLIEQKAEIESKNEDITASIEYAKRIQEAMLPNTTRIQEAIPASFIFYLPRDIVSGDFYWLANKGDKIIIAVADCTGHGVPGALMSMIGDSLLNHIIHDREIHQPDLILYEMHKGIQKSLNQRENENQDGMDIAVVVWEKEKKQAFVAAARSSIIYFKNNEITLIKGDRNPIGGDEYKEERNFTAYQIDLDDEQPTMFYLYSDGFQDQFGGEKNKKMGIEKLRTFLESIQGEELSAQKEKIATFFQQWRGTNEQTDDVLLMGFKI